LLTLHVPLIFGPLSLNILLVFYVVNKWSFTDVERILKRLEEVDLTLSIDKSKFGFDEIVVVGHLCGRYRRKPNLEKVDAIARMKACSSTTEVRRFLRACVFYQIWIPHFVHMAAPLYKLLRKGTKFA